MTLVQPDLHMYINAAWLTVAVVWLAGAFTTKKTVRMLPSRPSFVYVTLPLFLSFLLFTGHMRHGFLASRFLPMSPAAAYAGLVLTIAGCTFTIWSRFYLGSNWSARPTIKEGHTLIRSGPYGLVRHPIYTGIILAMLGTAIYIGEIRGLLGAVVALIALKAKSRFEESLMTEQFGPEYVNYKHQVKSLIPFVW
jgi:protein-S-isoprenylcysteine O-methyltransferase Ste14